MWQCEFFYICESANKATSFHCQPHTKKDDCEEPHYCNRNPKFSGQQVCVNLDVGHLMTHEEAKQCGLI